MECREGAAPAPVLSLTRFVGGVQRGSSPFCRVIEGVPQKYQLKGGRVGKVR